MDSPSLSIKKQLNEPEVPLKKHIWWLVEDAVTDKEELAEGREQTGVLVKHIPTCNCCTG